MNPTQRLPASLTPLEAARDRLLEGLGPVAPVDLPLAEALRSIAADMPLLAASPAEGHCGGRRLCTVVARSCRRVVLFAAAA